MRKPISKNFSKIQLWFVIFLLYALFFVLFRFDYSVFTTTQNSVPIFRFEHMNRTLIRPNQTHHVKDYCLGKYIYIQEIPSRFNQEIVKNCELITAGAELNMCRYLVNYGFGYEIENGEGVLFNKSFYYTNQFSLDVIFHNKMINYKCLTNNSSLASAIYVPFYAGLDVSKHLWGDKIAIRDKLGIDLLNLIVQKSEWKKMLGRDHFLVGGRPCWDFRRGSNNESHWGSNLRFLPGSNNMLMLSVESGNWKNDYAMPWPTSFHPSTTNEVLEWQKKMRKQKRLNLFAFAGAPRPHNKESIRSKIIEECQASKKLCKLLDCNYGPNGAIACDNPVNTMKLFQNSIFCLQPTGDSFTRRSMFDSIVAGCIPVFFHPASAYSQYKWHLPKNYSKYSVFIPVRSVDEWKSGINETLHKIPQDRVVSMREEVIRLIPRIIYANPKSKLNIIEDAFDLAIKGILERIEEVRRLIKEGKDPTIGFADDDHNKLSFSGYVGEI